MRVFFIVNVGRRARKPPTELLASFAALLTDHGIEHKLETSQSADESRKLACRAVQENYDALWIGGGDGSINHILNATFGSGITYGIVPMGTMNALARSLGIPVDDPVAAVRYLLDAKPTPIDVVQLNDRYFVCFCSIGFHAAVMHGLNSQTKRHLGRVAFWTSGIRAAMRTRHLAEFKIEICPVNEPIPEFAGPSGVWEPSGQTENMSGYSAIISNVCNYVGFGIVRPEACSSRYLELHLFHSNKRVPMVRWFAEMAMGDGQWPGKERDVKHIKIASCTLRSDLPMLAQMDGEPLELKDPNEIKITCLRKAALMLLK